MDQAVVLEPHQVAPCFGQDRRRPGGLAVAGFVVADGAEHATQSGLAARRDNRIQVSDERVAGVGHRREPATQRLERGEARGEQHAASSRPASIGTQIRRKISDGSPNARALPKLCVR